MSQVLEQYGFEYTRDSAILNGCKYHNIVHAVAVLSAIDELQSEIEDPTNDTYRALRLAAAWHDAVYIPGSGVNEAASARAMRNYFHRNEPRCIVDESIVWSAETLIRHTTIDDHLTVKQNTTLSVLLDADLSSLAAPYDRFCVNQRNIIMENNGDPDSNESKMASANFLEHLAGSRVYLFRTKTGRKMWEKKAQENISKWIKECRESSV